MTSKNPRFMMQMLLVGAVRVTENDTAERTKRIAIAQLYRRYRAARLLVLREIGRHGPETGPRPETMQASIEAWNSLQVMKAVLWAA